jgi:hypothetical protein
LTKGSSVSVSAIVVLKKKPHYNFSFALLFPQLFSISKRKIFFVFLFLK